MTPLSIQAVTEEAIPRNSPSTGRTYYTRRGVRYYL
jgi:hypothetical protein